MWRRGLRIAEMNWPVFPVRGKTPLIKGWPVLATTDPDQIRKWAREFPRMTGWGITTAWDRAVFDVDIPAALPPELRAMVEDWAGPKVLTSKGVHCYGVAHPGQRTRIRPVDGADLKAGGGYVLAPGSLHPKSGKRYVEAVPITAELSVFPAVLLERIAPPRIFVPRRRPVIGPRTAVRTLRLVEDRVIHAPPGARNRCLYGAARDIEPFVSARIIDVTDATTHLLDAAVTSGLDPVEAQRTIESGLRPR